MRRLASILGLLLLPAPAAADGEYVVVLEFRGQRAPAARGTVVAMLESRVQLVPLDELLAAASEVGVRRLEGHDLTRACGPVRASAAIAGEVSGGSLQLTLLNCADGRVLDQYTVPYRGRRLNTDALRRQLDILTARLADASAPEDGEGEGEPAGGESEDVRGTVEDGEEQEQTEEEQEPEQGSSGSAEAGDRDMLSLGASVEFGGRAFIYTDPITSNLRPYSVFGVPLIAVSGELYPLARSSSPVLGDLGLVASYSRAIGLSSEVSGGAKVDTAWDRLGVGVKARIRTGARSPMFGIAATYGFQHFNFSGADPVLADELPDVSYTFLRVGADARVPYDDFALLVGVGFLGVLSAGQVADHFPNSTANGADAYAGATLKITDAIEGRLTAQYTRFFYTMSPEVGAPYVAGGALDEYLGLQVGAAYVH